MKLKKLVKAEIKKNNIIIERKKFRSNVGRATYETRKIKIPIITDIESIYIILHEIGHIVKKHSNDIEKPLYLQETEAELFALSKFRDWNIHHRFPEDYELLKQRAQRYIRWNILFDIQRSLHESKTILRLKNIHIKALKFTKIQKFQKEQKNLIIQKNKNKNVKN